MSQTTLTSTISLTGDQSTRWLITGGCGFIGTNLIKNWYLKKATSSEFWTTCL